MQVDKTVRQTHRAGLSVLKAAVHTALPDSACALSVLVAAKRFSLKTGFIVVWWKAG